MTIAMDADETAWVRARLSEASGKMAGAVPAMPGGAAFGSATLAGAVAAFDAAVRREAEQLRERWEALDAGVRDTFDEMNAVDDGFVGEMQRMRGMVA